VAVKTFFTGKWALLTLGMVLLAAVFVRLGIWQLDRLAQRRATNAVLSSRANLPAIDLNSSITDKNSGLTADPASLEYRPATVTGKYDFSNQVALIGQTWNGQLGVDLLTPLIVQGTNQSILVDRGWIPASDLHRDAWGKYDQPGIVTVQGMLLPGGAGSSSAVPVTGGNTARVDLWSSISLVGIQKQVAEPLLAVYLQEKPAGAPVSPPYARAMQIDLSEGPHLGYAIEWFSFAAMVIVGYPLLARRRTRQAGREPEETMQKAAPGRGREGGGIQQ
jgi:surfeit locus 1 family protein